MVTFIVSLSKAGYSAVASPYFLALILVFSGRLCQWGLAFITPAQKRALRKCSYKVFTLLQTSLRSIISAVLRFTNRIRLSIWPDYSLSRDNHLDFPGHNIPSVTVTDEAIELIPINPPTPTSSSSTSQNLPPHTFNDSLHLRDASRPKSKKSHSAIPLSRAASHTDGSVSHSASFFKYNRNRNPTPPSSISSTPPLTPSDFTTPEHTSSIFSHLRPNRIPSGTSVRTTTSSILGIGPIPAGISCASSLANLCASMEMQVMSNQIGLEDWRGRVAREAETMVE